MCGLQYLHILAATGPQQRCLVQAAKSGAPKTLQAGDSFLTLSSVPQPSAHSSSGGSQALAPSLRTLLASRELPGSSQNGATDLAASQDSSVLRGQEAQPLEWRAASIVFSLPAEAASLTGIKGTDLPLTCVSVLCGTCLLLKHQLYK